MRFRNAIRLAVPLLLVALATTAIALDVPKLRGRVNDYAQIIPPTRERALDTKLMQFERQTTNQVVVLTVPSLEGDPIEDFAIRVAEEWKIGAKDRDNGVILVVAPNDRKVRIEVGYGLEGALTDLESGRIIQNDIVPAFRRGDLAGGIEAGLNGIMQATVGEYKGNPEANRIGRKGQSGISGIFTLLFILVIMFTRVGRMFWPALFLFGGGRGGGGFGGGGFSGGGGGFGGGGASGSW